MNILKLLQNILCSKYKNQLSECQKELEHYENLVINLNNQIKLLKQKIKELNNLQLPDFNYNKIKLIDIYQHIPVTSYQTIVADLNYYAIDYDNFVSLLNKVNDLIKATWTTEVFDCDDFALLQLSLTTYTIYKKTNLNHQLALSIAWSNTHAYNLFLAIAPDDTIIPVIYEPQTKAVIPNKFSDKPPYNTKKIYFMG